MEIGVCNWSLQAGIAEVAKTMKKLGLKHVHLAVGPALEDNGGRYLLAVKQQNWTISSTMIDFPQEDYSTLESIRTTGGIVPDEYWQTNHNRFIRAAEITAKMKVKYLSMHAGFIDHTQAGYRRRFYDRICCLADEAGERGVMLLMETGQETADELRHFLAELDHPAVGVNFDPANMILYDKGEPIEAVSTLAAWIKHVHIKDAVRTDRPGTWGTEVVWGDGQAGGGEFLNILKRINYDGVLAIEREAGQNRIADITTAVERLRLFVK